MFTLKIRTDNAAFGDNEATASDEIARILRDTAKFLILDQPSFGVLRDSNGNRVGEFKFTWKG